MEDYERILLVKNEVFVFKIPPLANTKGHKAADWNLDAPDWVGRLRLFAIGSKLEVRLEDKSSGALYAKCPVDSYPGAAINAVLDSSRYFVMRLRSDTGRTAFVGVGFVDRSDSFDLNVALQDHFKQIEKDKEFAKADASGASAPSLDLAFKEGQTISINIGKKDGSKAVSRPKPASSSTGGFVPLLPPPPSGAAIRPRPQQQQTQASTPTSDVSNQNLLDF